jgi:phage baseplate assembly protein W
MAQPIGLDLPIQRGDNGFFKQSFDTATVVRNNLKTLLLTRRGEVPMNPTFGADLYSILFEQNEDVIEEVVKQKIIDAVETWLPYININSISFDRSNNNIDVYALVLTIKYTSSATANNIQELSIEI